MLCFVLVGLFVLLYPQQAVAQESTTSDTVIVNALEQSTTITTVAALTLAPKHSPAKATWMSVALPGLGQAYNKQYWKIPIIYAGIGIVTYFAIDNRKGAKKFKQEYIDRENGDTAAFDPNYLDYSNENILNLYNSYQKNFELSLIFGGIVYLLNILDAYVFAHLFTFDLSEDISMNISPTVNYESLLTLAQPQIGFNMKFSFCKQKTKGKKLISYY